MNALERRLGDENKELRYDYNVVYSMMCVCIPIYVEKFMYR